MSTNENLSLEEKKEKIRQMLQKKQGGAAPAAAVKTAKKKSGKAVKPQTNFEDFEEIQAFRKQFDILEQLKIKNPYFRVNETITNNKTRIEGRELISYSSYNYLGYSGDPKVSKSAKDAIDLYGTSSSASRIATGEKPIHAQLEKELASFLGTEDSVVFVSGHATNVTVIGHLFRPQDLILFDELSHNSIIEGCLLSGARRVPFPHNDYKTLEKLLKENRNEYERILITVEGVYSMDGDIAPLDKFIELKKKYKALLYVDEAHSMGTIGETGRGIGEYYNVNREDVDFWMGTFSKSLASCGGYIAGKKALVEYLRYTTPGFLYSVGITPANAGAALGALKALKKSSAKVKKLQKNSQYFLELAKKAGLNTGISEESPVIPVIIGNSALALKLAHTLFEKGINVQPILYPAVPDAESRLRFFLTSEHTKKDMDYTIKTVSETLADLKKEMGVK